MRRREGCRAVRDRGARAAQAIGGDAHRVTHAPGHRRHLAGYVNRLATSASGSWKGVHSEWWLSVDEMWHVPPEEPSELQHYYAGFGGRAWSSPPQVLHALTLS